MEMKTQITNLFIRLSVLSSIIFITKNKINEEKHTVSIRHHLIYIYFRL